mmetsp:Transcript_2205/g.4930  ORF Transcript_2205/g.4930 Transcript_2205/m.4930 type:complete len:216 (+) Transcript_2205:65-712(+)|eukprot:CAMPEP_0197918808 /NCGR_PEP_ID=MMETSP1439-20131203/86129_1 /TAXON_ID=66791 /ORGANISM="Gonyaulax spinifera, Strain CCMP409" /LENGTH=215 /DNA_ID=CAMNT_0043540941 /DNA_START=64 /DNA_END=711 /DNA_ORIENTATION=-
MCIGMRMVRRVPFSSWCQRFSATRAFHLTWAPPHVGFLRSCSCAATGIQHVSLADLVSFVHAEINGSVRGLERELLDLAEILISEPPSLGTLVSLDDGRLLVEEIGASPDGLPEFLAQVTSPPDVELEGGAEEEQVIPEISTDELLKRIDQEPLGMRYRVDKERKGIMIFAKHGLRPKQFLLTDHFRKRTNVDLQLNKWFQNHLPLNEEPVHEKN